MGNTPKRKPPAANGHTAGLPDTITLDLDSFTIGEMDRIGELTRDHGVGHTTAMVWLALQRDGHKVTLAEVAALPASRLRRVRGEDVAAVPLGSASPSPAPGESPPPTSDG